MVDKKFVLFHSEQQEKVIGGPIVVMTPQGEIHRYTERVEKLVGEETKPTSNFTDFKKVGVMKDVPGNRWENKPKQIMPFSPLIK